MSCCVFFGHKEYFENITNKIYGIIKKLVEKEGVNIFYVGNQGAFDRMAAKALRQAKTHYPHIEYHIVLAYFPTNTLAGAENTLFPSELEGVPKKFAIDKRNKWMLKRADFVVLYVFNPAGGAAKYAALAKKQNKKMIYISQNKTP